MDKLGSLPLPLPALARPTLFLSPFLHTERVGCKCDEFNCMCSCAQLIILPSACKSFALSCASKFFAVNIQLFSFLGFCLLCLLAFSPRRDERRDEKVAWSFLSRVCLPCLPGLPYITSPPPPASGSHDNPLPIGCRVCS